MSRIELKSVVEAILLANRTPVSIARFVELFQAEPLPDGSIPDRQHVQAALDELKGDLAGRGVELLQVASGYRLQVRSALMPWVSRLWDEKPPRYSRALLETLALIAYRQPVTRGEIEDVRGVSVSTGIIKTLLEREWVKVVGHRDVPGKPALFATTPLFLDYFGMQNLEELPPLSEIQALGEANRQLDLDDDVPAARILEDDSETEDATQENVLETTAEDLQQADALVAQVETNLFGDSNGERPKRFGDLISRLSESQDEQDTPLDAKKPDGHTKSENT
ncbi:MAG: SMC-Scp complex subunit ScpB [Oceanospirillaceae bacterium]|nr:SMC-Scp complex subunit ScpB [Oceanospirillaceae bacterium]